jgi:hypothetical protein
MPWFFARQAEPEEQGGFTDLTSGITYCNQSKAETLNQAAMFEEREEGSNVSAKDGRVRDLPDGAQFNTTVLESDPLGFEYPARYRPGK